MSPCFTSMPECDSAMTMSAPSSFICGTQALAASTMSRVIDLAVEVLGVPDHDLRRHEADDADLDRLLGAGAVLDLLVEDHIGLEVELVVARIGGELGAADQVGADEREVGAGQHLVEEDRP